LVAHCGWITGRIGRSSTGCIPGCINRHQNQGLAFVVHQLAPVLTPGAMPEAWTRDIPDGRVHGTTGETPKARFDRDEARVLRLLAGTSPFTTARDLIRSVGADCAIAVDGNAYSVPWRLIGERVRVTVSNDVIRVHHGGREVAVHTELKGRHGRVVDDAHLAGLVGTKGRPAHIVVPTPLADRPASALLRPLAEYEAVAGGGF
jgi:hypothetical protein